MRIRLYAGDTAVRDGERYSRCIQLLYPGLIWTFCPRAWRPICERTARLLVTSYSENVLRLDAVLDLLAGLNDRHDQIDQPRSNRDQEKEESDSDEKLGDHGQ